MSLGVAERGIVLPGVDVCNNGSGIDLMRMNMQRRVGEEPAGSLIPGDINQSGK